MRRSIMLSVLASCASLCLHASARADVAELSPAKDNTLYETIDGDVSNGAGEHFFAGVTAIGDARRALMVFDIASAIPAGSTIISAELTLHMSRTENDAQVVELHHLLADWGEGPSDAQANEGVGAIAEIGDATWLHTFHATDFWGTPGGDFDAQPLADVVVDDIGFYSWSSAALTADVQDALDNPANHFGWVLTGNETQNQTTKRFDTRENANPDLRPVLSIEYVPEPATMSLMLIAMAKLIRRRR